MTKIKIMIMIMIIDDDVSRSMGKSITKELLNRQNLSKFITNSLTRAATTTTITTATATRTRLTACVCYVPP